MIVGPASPKEQKLPATFAGVLRGRAKRPAAPDSVLYTHGDPDWASPEIPPVATQPGKKGQGTASPRRQRQISLFDARARIAPVRSGRHARFAFGGRRRPAPRPPRRTPSTLEGAGKVRLADRLSPRGAEVFCAARSGTPGANRSSGSTSGHPTTCGCGP